LRGCAGFWAAIEDIAGGIDGHAIGISGALVAGCLLRSVTLRAIVVIYDSSVKPHYWGTELR